MEGLLAKEPPTSTRTSNPPSDRLDFDNDDGGNEAANQSLELSDAQDSDSDGELEEGEIQSEVETNDDDSRSVSEIIGKKDSDSKTPHIPNFNIVKCQQSFNHDSPSSSSLLDSSTDQFKTESPDIVPDSFDKSEVESSDGEIYSASEDNQACDVKEQSDDLFDMVFDFKSSDKDQSTADSLDDTLTEDIGEDVGRKRKHSSAENDEKVNNDRCPAAKKSRVITQAAAVAEEMGSDAGNLNENGLTHEFDVIDETNEDGGDNFDQDAGEYDSDEDDLDDNEIYAWLEEGVSKKSLKPEDAEEGPSQREKLVLQEKGSDPFDMLPEGWVLVTHNSGMPVYLHKQSRVVTFSKPYFIGPGSVRKHNIPVSGIPCLYYRREKEREAKQKAGKEAATTNTKEIVCNGESHNAENGGEKQPVDTSQPTLASLPVKIEYAEEREKENSLEPEELRKYCESLFEFRKITVNKFKTWKDRRRHLNNVKKQSRPALPSNTKLITCKVPAEKGDHKPRKKEFVLNPTGKSYVCILHEYAQHTLRVQPRYVFKELENAQNPYSATIIINEIEYGTGFAGSKRAAKMEAAKATLSILIPEMSKLIEKQVEEEEDLSFFDDIKIEDPRVYELCNKSGQPSPFQILLECLKRNYGLGDTQCKIDVKTLKHQKSEYTLTVGKHSVTVVCKNKREGKQSAAQAMLKQLHPHIYSLGALLRLYGRSSWKSVKEKKKEEHAITGLQSQVRSKKPNEPLLQKLKEEMMKIQIQRESVKTKGKFRVDTKTLSGAVTCIDL
ncbi:microprocessor complex subunit DGCR8-like [Saccostrea echinata]|uniref:microprocessor complex subunit DGCR8-like n=1 Tax=Saccostrea echinata TaxID=191078 RepID=UPI002A833F61|nr:microprocessor complex subunit DGCR8-like [Saccostrea echinata]XP_061189548.1 microprocessor complex subunit DGCR8-like [Saccostrea echinata]